jgi:hypothetical protein
MVPVSQKTNSESITKTSQCCSSKNVGNSEYLDCFMYILTSFGVLLLACKCRQMALTCCGFNIELARYVAVVVLTWPLYCHMHQIRVVYSDEFLRAEGVPGAEVHQRLSVQYGNSASP